MIPLTFAERYQQARTYAAQVRVRKAMGVTYAHAAPRRGPRTIKSGYLNVERQLTEPSF